MAEILFITPDEISKTTIIGGNVQPDRFVMCIASVQITVIEQLLGSELYNKLTADFAGDTLTGDYLTLFNDFVQPITKNMAVAKYIEISSFLVENGGIFKHSAENRTQLTENEVTKVAEEYRGMANVFILRMDKWLCTNRIAEYKNNNNKLTSTHNGWYL